MIFGILRTAGVFVAAMLLLNVQLLAQTTNQASGETQVDSVVSDANALMEEVDALVAEATAAVEEVDALIKSRLEDFQMGPPYIGLAVQYFVGQLLESGRKEAAATILSYVCILSETLQECLTAPPSENGRFVEIFHVATAANAADAKVPTMAQQDKTVNFLLATKVFLEQETGISLEGIALRPLLPVKN